MLQEEQGRHSIIRVESDDEFRTILNAMRQKDSANIMVILQHSEVRQAFVCVDDFITLRTLENPLQPQVVFVVSKDDELIQDWALDNGFSVSNSELEALERLKFLENNTATSSPLDKNDEHFTALDGQVAMVTEQIKVPESPLLPVQSVGKGAKVKPSLRLLLLCGITIILWAAYLNAQGSSLSVPESAVDTRSGGGNTAGRVSFGSSGLFEQEGTIGVNDQVQITMDNVALPMTGKSYYVWLEADAKHSDDNVVGLGKLTFSGHTGDLKYQDPLQRNLLASFSQILITQESDGRFPTVPSLDKSDWRYSGGISQIPAFNDLKNHYSLLDHLRHLLADDPTLDQIHVFGGLDVWQYRNIGKLIEWTQSARDSVGNKATVAFVRRQAIRTLDYVDGTTFVYMDVPPGTPILVDPTNLRVGLIDVIPNGTPSSYMTHIGQHLSSLTACPGVTNDQIQRATQILNAINQEVDVLKQVRKDAKQLVVMTDSQLQQPEARVLLSDMANQASDAYSGSSDPITGNLHPASVWIHGQMRLLATFTLSSYAP